MIYPCRGGDCIYFNCLLNFLALVTSSWPLISFWCPPWFSCILWRGLCRAVSPSFSSLPVCPAAASPCTPTAHWHEEKNRNKKESSKTNQINIFWSFKRPCRTKVQIFFLIIFFTCRESSFWPPWPCVGSRFRWGRSQFHGSHLKKREGDEHFREWMKGIKWNASPTK